MLTKRTWMFALTFIALGITFGTNSFVLGKGKPAPEPDPVSPISFHLTMLPSDLGILKIKRMNNQGDIVGQDVETANGSAFLYRHSTGVLSDLNDLLPVGSNWFLESAEDINDSGQIVGRGYVGNDPETHAYRFTPADAINPATIEDLSISIVDHLNSSANALNNNGDAAISVLKTDNSYVYSIVDATGNVSQLPFIGAHNLYDMNDTGQLVCRNKPVGYSFLYTPGIGEETFLGLDGDGTPMEVRSLNNSGQLVGATGFYLGKGKKYEVGAGRYTDGVGIENMGISGGHITGHGWSINVSGDCVATDGNDEGYFYLDSDSNTYPVRNTVTTSDTPAGLQEWENAAGRFVVGINDGQQICGWVKNPNGSKGNAFLLTPIDE